MMFLILIVSTMVSSSINNKYVLFSACSLTQHLAGASHMLLVVPQTTSCNEILNLYSIAMNHMLT